ncbi:MAG: DNA alkylation repair protein, partial [Thermoplasmata archaeon]|nr:DNA alkylation repair protein [Thermoplasmata archaeon]
MAFPEDAVEQCMARLKELGRSKSASLMNKFIKTELECYGATVTNTHKLAKEIVQEVYADGGLEKVLDLSDALWNEPVFEARMLAISLLKAIPKEKNMDVVKRIVPWFSSVDNWAHCDALSGYVLGEAIVRDEKVLPLMKRWTTNKNPWKRRAALIAPIPLYRKKRGKPEFTFKQLEILEDEKEYYVKKAFDWILTEIGKRYPDELHSYLMENGKRYNRTQLKKCTKYLPERYR